MTEPREKKSGPDPAPPALRPALLLVAAGLTAPALLVLLIRPLDAGWYLAAVAGLDALAGAALAPGGRPRLSRVAVGLAAAVLVSALLELALPPAFALFPAPGYPKQEWLDPYPYGLDPELGWAPRPGASIRHAAYTAPGKREWSVVYHIGADGLRVTPASGGAKLALFFGDSFTFGHGLDDADTIPSRFEESEPDFRAVNYGVNDYGTAACLIRLYKTVEPRADLVFYNFIPQHVHRNLNQEIPTLPQPDPPLFRLAIDPARPPMEWELVLRPRAPFNPEDLHHRLLDRSFFYRRLVLASFRLQDLHLNATLPPGAGDNYGQLLTARLVREMTIATRTKFGEGCRFIMVLLPMKDDYDQQAADGVVRLLSGIEVVDLKSRFDRHLQQTGESVDAYFDVASKHPNPRLARLLAAWLAEAIGGPAAP